MADRLRQGHWAKAALTDDSPKYLQLAAKLRTKMETWAIARNDRLPEKRLAYEYGVGRHSVVNALRMLVAEGYVQRHPGVGYVCIRGGYGVRP